MANTPTPYTPPALAPQACALLGQIEAQLRTPAAHFAPAGVRSCIERLGNLVAVMAARIDQLQQQQNQR